MTRKDTWWYVWFPGEALHLWSPDCACCHLAGGSQGALSRCVPAELGALFSMVAGTV